MRNKEICVKLNLLIILTIVTLLTGLLPSSVLALGPIDEIQPGKAAKIDDRPDPLSIEQRKLRMKALEARLKGKAHGKTKEVARGQYVELEREGEDPVWTVLGEFDDFVHNSIEEPNRDVDNSTIWEPDFNRDCYMDILFTEGPGVNSMRQYYIEQSSNRYTVYGDVTDWIQVSGDAWEYDDDRTHPSGGNAVWYFLDESVDTWYANQLADGKTPAEIDEYLSQFDVWDRYDWDGDGNFDEPDGYIDHAQFVHAGEGNEAGGGALGDDAIWSHSWFAFSNLIGVAGPSPDFLVGGVQIGNSSFWINKYTIQPENGGVGVFAHEYGHDLGLPDLYDYTGENSTGFWTLMSSGSWLSQSDEDIGSEPNHMGVWEKFQLGWLNYEVTYAASKSEHKLGPAETNTKQAQGLFVVLPDKEVITGTESAYYFNAYVAEFRQYRGFDEGLANVYNFGWGGVPGLGNWVEHFPYQDGLLVSYWDTSFADNNVGANCAAGRCGGLLLPVDAHSELMYRADGGIWRNRVQTYDSTFGLKSTDAITLHWLGEASEHPSQPAVPVFDDNISYYDSNNPTGSVITPQTGTQVRIKSVSAKGSFMQVQVRPSK